MPFSCMLIRSLVKASALSALVALALPSSAHAQAALKPDDDGGARQSLTPQQRKALHDAMKQLLRDDDAGLKPVLRKDGTEGVDLQGRFQSVAVARLEDGKVVTGCVTNAAEAEAFVNGATPHQHQHEHAIAEEK
jgi:hypothetical protein